MKYTREDIKRRQKINKELNPRVEIPNEATQTINPITGKVYLDQCTLMNDLHLSVRPYVNNFPSNIEDLIQYNNPMENSLFFDKKFEKPKSRTNDFIEYSLALARMNVRDGKMDRFTYTSTRNRIKDMVEKMNDANIPLSLISSQNGLDSALGEIETEERFRDLSDKIIYGDFESKKKFRKMKNIF